MIAGAQEGKERILHRGHRERRGPGEEKDYRETEKRGDAEGQRRQEREGMIATRIVGNFWVESAFMQHGHFEPFGRRVT